MNGESRRPQANVIAALTYLLGFVTGIIFLFLEPYNQDEFIRFHARQSIGFSVAWFAIEIVFPCNREKRWNLPYCFCVPSL